MTRSRIERMTTRRDVLFAMGFGAVAAPFSAFAQSQPGKIPRIGFLARTSADTLAPLLDSFRQGLRDLGWVDGRSIGIEYRFGDDSSIA
jgi:putative ABC transport system substrate-binding protein